MPDYKKGVMQGLPGEINPNFRFEWTEEVNAKGHREQEHSWKWDCLGL